MLIFYPRDIVMWRKLFCFDKIIRPSIWFKTKESFIWFLEDNGVIIDDPSYPLTFNESTCSKLNPVKQWTIIGWVDII